MKKSLLFFALFTPLFVFSQAKKSKEKTNEPTVAPQVVFAGFRTIIHMPVDSTVSEKLECKTMLAKEDCSKATLVPSKYQPEGYYDLTPNRNFEGIITVVTVSLKDNRILDKKQFKSFIRPVIDASLGGKRNCRIEIEQIRQNPILNVGKAVSGPDSTKVEVDSTGRFKIQGFKITLTAKGRDPMEFHCTGSRISTQALDALNRMPQGSKIYFDYIKVNDKLTEQQYDLRTLAFRLE